MPIARFTETEIPRDSNSTNCGLPDIEESLTHRFVENDDDANLIATVES
jgi:hypothetical protein